MATDSVSVPAEKLKLERIREVQARTGLCTVEIYRLMRENQFPKNIAISKQARAWVSHEVTAWIEDKIAAGRKTAA
jgi:prophage regulatory protein